jgi:hypothetical protein
MRDHAAADCGDAEHRLTWADLDLDRGRNGWRGYYNWPCRMFVCFYCVSKVGEREEALASCLRKDQRPRAREGQAWLLMRRRNLKHSFYFDQQTNHCQSKTFSPCAWSSQLTRPRLCEISITLPLSMHPLSSMALTLWSSRPTALAQ